MTSFKQRISEVLIAQRLVTQAQLDTVIAEAARNGKSFAQLLIDRGLVSEAQLT